MASVVSYEVITDRPQADGRRYVKYQVTFELNNLEFEIYNSRQKLVAADFDTAVDMPIVAAQMLADQLENEISEYVDLLANGTDPLHVFTTWWEKATPDWNTWDDAAGGVLKIYLAYENQLELRHIADTTSRISNADIEDVLGITAQQQSDIRSDIQIAVNTQATLDTYDRWFDEDGNLVQ